MIKFEFDRKCFDTSSILLSSIRWFPCQSHFGIRVCQTWFDRLNHPFQPKDVQCVSHFFSFIRLRRWLIKIIFKKTSYTLFAYLIDTLHKKWVLIFWMFFGISSIRLIRGSTNMLPKNKACFKSGHNQFNNNHLSTLI